MPLPFARAVIAVAITLLAVTPALLSQTVAGPQRVVIDVNAATQPFPHYWERMFGSGRAILALRDDYRKDLRAVKSATGFEYVRFHAIFHDEVGVYDEDAEGKPHYNFSYVDEIYDGLLAEGVKPFVELSFMPRKLALKQTDHAFWYKPNTEPPKDWQKWDALIAAFTNHLIERYGLEEVSQWYFEVWNEPNLDFWSGEPRQSTYWELYDHTARAIKGVNSRLRVGGPATAQAAWVDAFIKHCADNHVPADFVSTHVYGDDSSQDVFGKPGDIPRNEMVCRSVQKVHDQIQASAMPALPLIWSEFNATYKNETQITDSTFMGPWLADTIVRCNGLTRMMSLWAFSDVFEEQGVVKTPLYGGYGLIAERDIPKAAFNAIKLLHRLGDQRIPTESDSLLATRRKDGTVVIALWNYSAPDQTAEPRRFELNFSGSRARQASMWRVDDDHGDVRKAYLEMKSPASPTASQIKTLQQAGELGNPEAVAVKDHLLEVTVPSHGLALVELH